MRKDKIAELSQYIEELKTIRVVETQNSPRFLSSKVYEVYLNNGEIITREKLFKNNLEGSAAIILPVTIDNEVLLIVEPRFVTKETVGVGLPAGYIESGEDPIYSARRELVEETGYVAKDIIEMDSFYQDEGCSSSLNHIFIALGCEKKEKQHLDEGEFVRYFTCTYEEALELVEQKYIRGANSKLALLEAKQYLKGR